MRTCRIRPARLFASAALLAAIAAVAAGCQTTQSTATTGSLALTPPTIGLMPIGATISTVYGQQYRADPSNVAVALRYAQALRATGQRAQARRRARSGFPCKNPHNKTVLGAYGRALAEAGDYQQALDVLDRAHTPDQPDWHILSAQGAVLDQMGRHAEAQRHYRTALKIVPNEPSVLSNLGLSYALSKDLPRRRDNAAPRRGADAGRSARAAEPGAGRRPARPLRRSRNDRPRRSAAGRGRRQRRLSAPDAGATEDLRKKKAGARPRNGR